MIEKEIKLMFGSPSEARAAILAAGAAPLRCRRLQEDAMFDTGDELLRRSGCALRVRSESGRSLLTFKGPVQAGIVKTREEHETVVSAEVRGVCIVHAIVQHIAMGVGKAFGGPSRARRVKKEGKPVRL